jgi:tetratricopeptide (TPR) repeat protein
MRGMFARLLRILAAALAASVLLVAPPLPEAEAQTRGQIRRARALFARGIRLYDRQRYTQALRVFTRAYQLAPAPPIVFNIAQCHQALGADERAVESYELYLQVAPDAPNRAAVERKIRQLRAHIAAEQRARERQIAREVRREQREIADDEQVRTQDEEDGGGGGSVSLVTWITLGTGVVATGVGALFHLDAVAQQDALDDPQLDCSRAIARCLDIVETGDRSAMARTILLSAGGAILVTGVVMFILDLGSDDEEASEELTLRSVIGPEEARLEVRGAW